ncbi:HAD-IA family hydrolase [Bosea sp. (in: a-proteobacteria)]|uniref:HAD-IA family hydrolase n=1 Tax=Bosea sp. (in: a-proteobacteria) TaxID=1871050 RepID=UPI0025C0B843|nr:HAD-IA family hydrolase [Bosea sp. (in: a-proteobacteria)]MBR3193450.1 HAD-IA family hydrolase [Bosea sp. (in: a-proteobacteria)]
MDLIIFDLDGTLINSEAIILGAQYETFARCGRVHPGREAGLGVIGLTLDIALMRVAGLTEPDDVLTQTYREVFNGMRQRAESDPGLAEPLFPGVVELLAGLSQRPATVLGIATGKSRRGADYIVERHGWAELFKTIQTADDAISKPHPEMILRAIVETGARPERTLMVGDSTFDMEMAVAAGVTPVAVSWGFQPVAALQAAGARHVIESCAELTGIVDRLAMAEPA